MVGLGLGAAAAALALWLLVPAEVGTPPVPTAGAHRFALEAPQAASVAVVGDFNDWNPAAAPLTRTNGGLWTVDVELPRGSYRYAFVIDGTQWTADPNAAGRLMDDFGDGNSIVTVEGTS
jgi:1,4-alpha-glucan branching enzyme